MKKWSVVRRIERGRHGSDGFAQIRKIRIYAKRPRTENKIRKAADACVWPEIYRNGWRSPYYLGVNELRGNYRKTKNG